MLKNFQGVLTSFLKKIKSLFSLMAAIGMAVRNAAIFLIHASRFWAAKIKRNQQRDRIKRMELKKIGITAIRIWEHELKDTAGMDKAINKILTALKR